MTAPMPETVAPAVAVLSADDAPACTALSQAAGWAHTVEDWRSRLAHGTGFGLRVGPALVCVAVVLSYPGRGSFLGMLLTHPAHRGRGLAAALMRHCIDWAAAQDRPLALFSVPAAIGLYLRLGLSAVEGRGLCSLRGFAAGPSAGSRSGVRAALPADLPAIAALDAEAVGYDRSALLADMLARGAPQALVAMRDGVPVAYALGLRRGEMVALGPVVAPDDQTGLAMLGVQLASLPAGTPVRIDVPSGRPRLLDGLTRHGLAHAATLPFMVSRPAEALPYREPLRVVAAYSAIAG